MFVRPPPLSGCIKLNVDGTGLVENGTWWGIGVTMRDVNDVVAAS
jgi:hypothetical protein